MAPHHCRPRNWAITLSTLLLLAHGTNASVELVSRQGSPIIPYLNVSGAPPATAGAAVLDSFISYSIEFSSFPDFAGNRSYPNRLTRQLMQNLQELQGGWPIIRVGGNTQDYAVFVENQTEATIGTIIPSISEDYPRILTFGPAYFESYEVLTDPLYIHGFNLGKNSSADRAALLASVPYLCSAFIHGRLLYWQLGNEPDLFKTSAQGIVRPANWTERAYVDEWLTWKRALKREMETSCSETERVPWLAPGFAGTDNSLKPIKTWNEGLNADKDIPMYSSHNYIGGATQPGVTLQGTLMNHTKTVSSIASQVAVLKSLAALNSTLPFILGETNSLYNQGRPGLSNTFGAALWVLDFNLWCASQSIRRVHIHMGTNYRYAPWQPVDTSRVPKGTKAPYYGTVAAAAALADLSVPGGVRVANIPLAGDHQSAYAVYAGGKLARLAVVNLNGYNSTAAPSAGNSTAPRRPSSRYEFQVPGGCAGGLAQLQRLWADGSDAITGISFGGFSYAYELDGGRPVRLANVTAGETVRVGSAGTFALDVPASSAVVLHLEC